VTGRNLITSWIRLLLFMYRTPFKSVCYSRQRIIREKSLFFDTMKEFGRVGWVTVERERINNSFERENFTLTIEGLILCKVLSVLK